VLGPPTLNLLVLRCKDIEKSRDFYEIIGFTFEKHQHGKGLPHYASEKDGVVFELYPSKVEPDKHTRIGFTLPSVDVVETCLDSEGYDVIEPMTETSWGIRSVVRDPDGRTIELTLQQKEPNQAGQAER